jgi:predicted dehydrogenase
LQRQFKEILARDAPATNIPEGRAAYYVAQAWAAFHEAIVTSTPYAPGFEEALKIHDVLDAAEASAATRAWASVNKAASAA